LWLHQHQHKNRGNGNENNGRPFQSIAEICNRSIDTTTLNVAATTAEIAVEATSLVIAVEEIPNKVDIVVIVDDNIDDNVNTDNGVDFVRGDFGVEVDDLSSGDVVAIDAIDIDDVVWDEIGVARQVSCPTITTVDPLQSLSTTTTRMKSMWTYEPQAQCVSIYDAVDEGLRLPSVCITDELACGDGLMFYNHNHNHHNNICSAHQTKLGISPPGLMGPPVVSVETAWRLSIVLLFCGAVVQIVLLRAILRGLTVSQTLASAAPQRSLQRLYS
jgi:hypothetical protein